MGPPPDATGASATPQALAASGDGFVVQYAS
jgi:hypothetical protein